MTNRYCDKCGHEKLAHIKKRNGCGVKDCECERFVRGPERDCFGNEVK